ncbi:MAG: diacylglycerol kinase family protein [Gemmatimonadaceae bacterium]
MSSILALVNRKSGTADKARAALSEAGAFDVQVVEPERLCNAIAGAVADGRSRIVVAGGDGSIASAARCLVGTGVELGIVPGGTLNHFAHDLGIPADLPTACEIAADHTVSACADVGYVNGRLFLNTSSVGAYVKLVRTRERLERRLGYRIASAAAAMRVFLGIPRFDVELEAEGVVRRYRTPIVFVGVGERELRLPTLGKRVPGGRRGLHVMVVRGRTRAGLLALAFAAVARGVRHASATPKLDSFIVDRCRVILRRRGPVAVDGEIVELDTPLEYELAANALKVVVREKATLAGRRPA